MAPQEICRKRVAQVKTRYRKDTEGSRSVVGYPFCRLDRAASSRKPNDDEQERRQAGGDHEMMLNLFSDDTPFFTQKITGGDKGAGPNHATRVRVKREDRRFEL